ncbi:cell wall / vacuolar inhibitor of fructosidase 1-like [Magnolia sinica]|uniref:cell wall / vacuolar inhibitor of fructosidase 1-like n=1 Tax=Magnolia sinica TaxID=86752 RepID=UPI00265A0CF3|nr:cell wall / vacuolar inhibitor of fructosidase 1-like [Magnolia sinica]
MASLPSLLLLLILSFLFFLHPSFARVSPQSTKLVDKVCKLTPDYAFCIQSLDSKHRTSTANLTGLGRISLDVALYNAKETFTYISELVNNVTDPTISVPVGRCFSLYQTTISYILSATTNFEMKSYEMVKLLLSERGNNPKACEAEFKNVKSPLTRRNKDMSKLIVIAEVIAGLLA